MHTFGEHFRQFARSVDIVSRDVYDQALKLVAKHLREELGGETFAVSVAQLSGLLPQLVADWPVGDWWIEPIKSKSDAYVGQAAFAYGEKCPLWIVGASGEPLANARRYKNLMPELTRQGPIRDLPRYARLADFSGARTSIILTLRTGKNDVFGVMNVESTRVLKYSAAWHDELRLIADGISLLYKLRVTNELQVESTQNAKEALERVPFVPITAHRTMFLASSARADRDVMSVLTSVLSSYEDHFDLVSWTDPQAGNIIENIWDKISNCTYGACYFSEPATSSPPGPDNAKRRAGDRGFRYSDNPNVLFEAGILYALRRMKRGPLRKLLLLREEGSSKIPFDLSTEFIVQIRRLRDGRVNATDLERELRRTMRVLLGG